MVTMGELSEAYYERKKERRLEKNLAFSLSVNPYVCQVDTSENRWLAI